MALAAFAGGLLFSVGSDHHRSAPAVAGPAVPVAAGELLSLDRPGEHDHRHGTEWTPTTSSRVRIVAPAVISVQPRHQPPVAPPTGDTHAAGTALPAVAGLTQPGVLRV